MNLVKRVVHTIKAALKPAMVSWFGAHHNSAGVPLTDEKGLQISAVYSCVDRLASGVAMLPCVTYQLFDDDTKERAKEFYLYDLLRYQPNRWQSAFEFWQWNMICAVFRGNAYAFISREGGRIDALIPLHPDHITVMLYEDGDLTDIAYQYRPPNKEPVVFLKGEIFHVRGMPTSSPVVGTSVIAAQRETLGGAYATEEQANKHFANGTKLTGVIKVEGKMEKEQAALVREQWQEVYGGYSNSHKVAVLGSNADFQPISMSAADAQLLESRKFARSVVAGLLNVPEHMIGVNDHATFSNIEHQDIAWSKHSLSPWNTRIEQAIRRDLLTEKEKKQYFVEFLLDGLMRGDSKTRHEVYKMQIEIGMLSPNEARRKENMNPRPGGNVYLTPLNMRETGPDAAPPPTPAAAPSPAPEPNSTAAAELVKETANRVVLRNSGALRKAGKSIEKTRDASELIRVLESCEIVFQEVMGSVLRAIKPQLSIDTLAQFHASQLKQIVFQACEAGDHTIYQLNTLLDAWEITAVSNLMSELT